MFWSQNGHNRYEENNKGNHEVDIIMFPFFIVLICSYCLLWWQKEGQV